jgi:hypothetical protein
MTFYAAENAREVDKQNASQDANLRQEKRSAGARTTGDLVGGINVGALAGRWTPASVRPHRALGFVLR